MKVSYILSTILAIISGSDLLKVYTHWGATHFLDERSAVLISSSDLFKHLRWTHCLDGCSRNLVSESDLLKHCQWSWTHILDGCSPNLISGSQTLEMDSLAGLVFTRSHQWV